MTELPRPTRRGVLKASATTAAALSATAPTTSTAAFASGAAGSISDTPFGVPTASVPEPGVRIDAPAGDRTAGWGRQSRAEVLARNGVVATSQSVAAQAGARILAEGGNSADAAIATAAVLGVVELPSASIGGDSFALHYSAADGQLHGLNAAGWAPRAWDRRYFADRGFDERTGMPGSGIDSATVPGAVDGWFELLAKFGRTDAHDVLEPAAQLAAQGFGLTERVRDDWDSAVELLREDPDAARMFLVDGNGPELYSIVRNPELASAYRALQRGGPDAFYRGEIARAIVAKSRRIGGALTARDLADYRSRWVEPISVDYHGYRMQQLPPPNQGFAALIMLNIINQFPRVLGIDLAAEGPRAPRFWHLLVEAKKRAYDDLHRYNGDPDFAEIPVQRLLSDEHAAQLCRGIDPNRARPPEVPGVITAGTVYLSAADRWGNMTSFMYSHFEKFGSGVAVPGYGFPLQNRGSLFDLAAGKPNTVAGHKRPFHTLMPAFLTRDGAPVLSWANMGGEAQAQAQALEVVFMVDLGMNPQAATDAARFCHSQADDLLELERELHAEVGAGLAALGHRLDEPSSSSTGGYQAILFTPERPGERPASTGPSGPVNGVYRAASDHRKDGSAVGW